MDKTSTNINKTNIHLSSQLTSLNTTTKTRHMTLELQVLTWGQHIHVTGIKPFNVIFALPS
jgi:hypothetical protein